MSDNPFVKPIESSALINPDRSVMVVLERVEPGVVPDYCVHGTVTCFNCNDWCWLGDKTFEVVSAGKATGMCMQCAIEINEKYPLGDPIENLGDSMGDHD